MGEISSTKSRLIKDLIFETYSIRKKNIISITDFYDSENYIINSFISTIHLVTYYNETFGFSNLLFYVKRDGSKHVVTNETILNYFLKGTYIYTTSCGIILIWGISKDYPPTNFICSTIDMENFHSHNELNDFLDKYYIYRFIRSEETDLTVVKNKLYKSLEVKKLNSQINLQNDNSVSISFSEYILE